jgi:hypothetical protein
MLSMSILILWFISAGNASAQGGYIVGDFHQHSTYSDGSYSIQYVHGKNNTYGLDWWSNSEHGGGFTTDAAVTGTDLGTTFYWDQYIPNPILGNVSMSGSHQRMWRWQMLRDYSFAQILIARQNYPGKVVIQGVEWNVPGHEHGSVSIITNEFGPNANANAVAEFEYKFDANDADVTGGAAQGWTKSANPNNHTKTLEAVAWLQANHRYASWAIPAHPERQKRYTIAHFRDMNNAGPDVCFGFESQPGHQLDPQRGSYGNGSDGAGTYGGTGVYAAQIGGLWDAMLSEGRHWWLFASSDYHNNSGDFFPGEYQKTYTWVRNSNDPQSIVDGLRSGNSYIVEGDLITDLEFKAIGGKVGTMGEVIEHGRLLTFKIKVKDPQANNYNNQNPVLNHIDLIMGDVTGFIAPGDPLYNSPSVATTRVIARFDATGGVTDANGLKSTPWQMDSEGNIIINFKMSNLDGKHYFRLRGTNHGLGVASETDANGNPLPDALLAPNNRSKAFADLWFYSNPIFTSHNPTIPLGNWGIILASVLIALFFILRSRI